MVLRIALSMIVAHVFVHSGDVADEVGKRMLAAFIGA